MASTDLHSRRRQCYQPEGHGPAIAQGRLRRCPRRRPRARRPELSLLDNILFRHELILPNTAFYRPSRCRNASHGWPDVRKKDQGIGAWRRDQRPRAHYRHHGQRAVGSDLGVLGGWHGRGCH